MPLRSVMMKRFILGFQRRVWCPKWTPLSRSWRMVTTAMPLVSFCFGPGHACAPEPVFSSMPWAGARGPDARARPDPALDHSNFGTEDRRPPAKEPEETGVRSQPVRVADPILAAGVGAVETVQVRRTGCLPRSQCRPPRSTAGVACPQVLGNLLDAGAMRTFVLVVAL